VNAASNAINKAIEDHAAEQATPGTR
jgi:hypothetical protein